jgi:hypothetical protein
MLIAAFLIFSQIGNRRPYSRMAMSFRGPGGWYPFAYLFLALITAVIALVSSPHLSGAEFSLVDASAFLFFGAIFALVSLLTSAFSIFSAKSVAETVLMVFTVRSVLRYGLIEVTTARNGSVASYQLRSWGHRHGLFDPLGPFHDLVMEAVNDKERVTLHLYLNCLMARAAQLAGVPFDREFALATAPRNQLPRRIRSILERIYRYPHRPSAGASFQVVAHTLHYLVRRAQRLVSEWALDNHRQIITINIADLLLSLSTRARAEKLIDLCIDALIRLNVDYRDVPQHGSYEPVHGLFDIVEVLERRGFYEPANRLMRGLAYLDAVTPYVSRSALAVWSEKADHLPGDTVARFQTLSADVAGKSLDQVLTGTLWP